MSIDPLQNSILSIAAKVPYVRQAVGIMLMAMARPVFAGY